MAFLVVATSTHHKGEGRFSNQPKKPLPCFFAGWPVRILKSSQIEGEHKNQFFLRVNNNNEIHVSFQCFNRRYNPEYSTTCRRSKAKY